jgi:hypothetical protein
VTGPVRQNDVPRFPEFPETEERPKPLSRWEPFREMACAFGGAGVGLVINVWIAEAAPHAYLAFTMMALMVGGPLWLVAWLREYRTFGLMVGWATAGLVCGLSPCLLPVLVGLLALRFTVLR